MNIAEANQLIGEIGRGLDTLSYENKKAYEALSAIVEVCDRYSNPAVPVGWATEIRDIVAKAVEDE